MTGIPPEELATHIVGAARDAQDFVEGMSKERFLRDRKTQQAVVFSLMIIGEAAARLMDQYPDFVSERAQVPWRNMRGMRNRIAHGYFQINVDIVWDTVHEALPELQRQLSE